MHRLVRTRSVPVGANGMVGKYPIGGRIIRFNQEGAAVASNLNIERCAGEHVPDFRRAELAPVSRRPGDLQKVTVEVLER